MKSTHGDASDWRRPAYVALCTLLSVVVFATFLTRSGIDNYGRARVADVIRGDAHRPYVYRTLLPTTARIVVGAIPRGAREHIEETWGQSTAMRHMFQILDWNPDYFPEFIVTAALMYAALWGFIVSLRALFSAVYAAPPVVKDAVTLVALLGLTQFYWNTTYLYDFPALFLFTLGLALMVRRRWAAYLVVFVLGCFNKETIILLTMVFVIHFWNHERRPRRFKTFVLVQVGLFAAIKSALAFVYRDNPGEFVEFHLFDHNLDLWRAYSLATIVACGAFILFLFHDWRGKPAFLRHGLWIMIPLFVLGVFIGYLDEIRIYYEAYAIVVLLLAHSASHVLGFELRSRPELSATR